MGTIRPIFHGKPGRYIPEAEDLIAHTVHDLLPPTFEGPRKPYWASLAWTVRYALLGRWGKLLSS